MIIIIFYNFHYYNYNYISQFSLRENDYVLDARKIGGNAQSIIRDRWVHHTSFLWDFNVMRMQYLQVRILNILPIFYFYFFPFIVFVFCFIFNK